MSPLVSHWAVSTGGAPGVSRSRKSTLPTSIPLASVQRSPVIVAGFAAANVTVLNVGAGEAGPPDRLPMNVHGLSRGSPQTSPDSSTVTRWRVSGDGGES